MKRNFYLTVTTHEKDGYRYVAYFVEPELHSQYVVDRDCIKYEIDEDFYYYCREVELYNRELL